MNSVITSAMLEKVVNQYINLDPEAINKLATFKGKVLCVEVLGLNKQYYVIPEGDRVEIKSGSDISADTTISGLPSALIKLALQSDTAPLMLSGEIEITGDVRLGRAFKKFH